MDLSLRSVVTAGVTAMTASAIVIAPAVTPLPQHRSAEIALAADVRPVRPLVDDLTSLTSLVHTDQAATQRQALVGGSAAVGALSAGSTVMDIYNAIEPWVQYGFEVATWAVGWVPVVGIFSGQIMVAYFTVEPLVRSVVQSFAYLLDLNIGAIPGTLVDGAVSAATAFVQGEINWVLGFFPPFPPFPPLPFATTALAAPMAELAGPMVGPTGPAAPIGNAIVDASHALAGFSHAVWTAVNSIGTRGGQAVAFALDRLQYLTGIWIPRAAVGSPLTPTANRDQISATLPALITDLVAPLARPQSVVAQKATLAELSTADPINTRVNRFAERRAERATVLADGQRSALAGTLQAQGKFQSIIKGATDIGAAAAQGKITNPKQSTKGVGDAGGKAAKGAKGLVSSVQKVVKKLTTAGKDTRKAVSDAGAN